MHHDVQTFERQTYRISEFSKAFRICRSKVYHEIKAGRLKVFKVGRATLISKAAAEAWQQAMESKFGGIR